MRVTGQGEGRREQLEWRLRGRAGPGNPQSTERPVQGEGEPGSAAPRVRPRHPGHAAEAGEGAARTHP